MKEYFPIFGVRFNKGGYGNPLHNHLWYYSGQIFFRHHEANMWSILKYCISMNMVNPVHRVKIFFHQDN